MDLQPRRRGAVARLLDERSAAMERQRAICVHRVTVGRERLRYHADARVYRRRLRRGRQHLQLATLWLYADNFFGGCVGNQTAGTACIPVGSLANECTSGMFCGRWEDG